MRARVSAAIAEGADVIVLSDRNSTAELAPIPSLLLVSAVHHHLVRNKTRTRVGLVVESGDAREVHHMALLKGYGAAAINPYLAFETIDDMIALGPAHRGDAPPGPAQLHQGGVQGDHQGDVQDGHLDGGLLHRAPRSSRRSASAPEVVDEYFTGTVSRIGGVGLDVLAEEVARRHRLAHLDRPTELAHREREVGGEYQWRREGEIHLFNPKTVFKLQHATRAKRYEVFKEYTKAVDDQSAELATLRGLMRLRTGVLPPVPIEEVEPVVGHRGPVLDRGHVLRVDLGRGPRDPGHRHEPARRPVQHRRGRRGPRPLHPRRQRRPAAQRHQAGGLGPVRGDLASTWSTPTTSRSRSPRGPSPARAASCPGTRSTRGSPRPGTRRPGSGSSRPPPHHDIYSIEDIAQLIHDLKSANPQARVHVKLVAEVGVGTVAAGVAKAHSDVVLISGHDGGTGAAPLTSLKHAGIPWELGLAETQQTLLANDLRDRIVVQVDGQMKTGRDVVIGALLGAEEFGFATAPLVVSGCIMMRVCHLDTCPVGIATQNPELAGRFAGKPEFVETFFEYIAEEVREHLAALGLRSLEEAVGRVDLLDAADGRRPLEGGRPRPGPDPGAAGAARGRGPLLRQRAGPRPRPGPRPRLPRAVPAGHRRRARRCAAELRHHQRRPHRRHPARLRDHPPPRRRRACPTGPSTSPSAARPARASAPSCPRA